MVQSQNNVARCKKTETRDDINNAAKIRTADQNQSVVVLCAASAVQRVAVVLNDTLNLSISTEDQDTGTIIDKTYKKFSNECQYFTLAMSLKHQLQNYLFTQNNPNLTNHTSQLSSILIYLQTIANSLDDIHSRKQSSHCVRLSADEYRIMYHVLYTNTTSLLSEIERRGREWFFFIKNIYEIQHVTCVCEVLYPTWK